MQKWSVFDSRMRQNVNNRSSTWRPQISKIAETIVFVAQNELQNRKPRVLFDGLSLLRKCTPPLSNVLGHTGLYKEVCYSVDSGPHPRICLGEKPRTIQFTLADILLTSRSPLICRVVTRRDGDGRWAWIPGGGLRSASFSPPTSDKSHRNLIFVTRIAY